MSETVTYPGFSAIYGPTTAWKDAPGPFYAITYTAPDQHGHSRQTVRVVDTLDEAAQIAKDAS